MEDPVRSRRIIGFVVLLVLAAVTVAVAIAAVRSGAAAVQRTGATAPGVAAPRVEVITDRSYLRRGVGADAQWSAALEDELDVDLRVRAGSDHGYLAEGTDSFTALAGGISPDTKVLILAGGVGRTADRLALAVAATRAYAAAKNVSPDVRVIVLPRPTLTDSDVATSTVLRNAAAVADARWVNPGAWFAAGGSTSGGSLTAKGTASAAKGFEALLRPLIG